MFQDFQWVLVSLLIRMFESIGPHPYQFIVGLPFFKDTPHLYQYPK